MCSRVHADPLSVSNLYAIGKDTDAQGSTWGTTGTADVDLGAPGLGPHSTLVAARPVRAGHALPSAWIGGHDFSSQMCVRNGRPRRRPGFPLRWTLRVVFVAPSSGSPLIKLSLELHFLFTFSPEGRERRGQPGLFRRRGG